VGKVHTLLANHNGIEVLSVVAVYEKTEVDVCRYGINRFVEIWFASAIVEGKQKQISNVALARDCKDSHFTHVSTYLSIELDGERHTPTYTPRAPFRPHRRFFAFLAAESFQ